MNVCVVVMYVCMYCNVFMYVCMYCNVCICECVYIHNFNALMKSNRSSAFPRGVETDT